MRKVIARLTGRVPDRDLRRTAAALAPLLGALGLILVPSAAAENVHVPTQTLTGFIGNAIVEPHAVAVDSSGGPHAGDVYVLDNGANRVVAYTSAGAFRTSWGKNVNEGTGNLNICSNAGPPENICKPGEFNFGNQPYQMGNAFGIAVDSSSGPSQGDVYVSANALIVKYDPSGNVVTSFGGGPFPGGIQVPNFNIPAIAVGPSGELFSLVENKLTKYSENGALLGTVTLPFNTPSPGAGGSLAVDPSGNLYVEATGEFGSAGVVEKLSPTGTELGQVSLAGGQNNGLAYDPGANELSVAYQQYPVTSIRAYRFNGSGEVLEPGGGTCALSATGCAASEEFAGEGELQWSGEMGLAVNTIDHTLWVTDTGHRAVRGYKLIDAPKLTTGATEHVTRTSAKFLGHVDPDGAGPVTTCEFEYGTTKNYELGSVPCSPATTSVPADVSAELPAETLKSETLYHYRLVAGNANGERPGADMTVETLKAVTAATTGSAENVGKIHATLNGSYVGDGVDTTYWFEYGQTEKYGQKTPEIDGGTTSGLQALKTNLAGLYAFYGYHYRFVARNSYGTTYGSDKTFQTEAPDQPSVDRTFLTELTQSGATLNAQIDTGEGLTVYRFEYGSSTALGSKTLVGGPLDPENPNSTVSTALSELSPGTIYFYRAVATNFAGTTYGPIESFTTLSAPTVDSVSVSGVTRTSVTLEATVNPDLSPTTYHFEYGTTNAHGSRTAESAPIGPDNIDHAASATVTGLQPGTTYHFRPVASNAIGTTAGPEATFTTTPPEVEQPHKETLKPCKKGFVRKHGKCVKRKRPKRHQHSHRSHRHGGRANG